MNDEICDESCECHEENSIEVGDNVFTPADGGSGSSERMKELIEKKRIKDLKINKGNNLK